MRPQRRHYVFGLSGHLCICTYYVRAGGDSIWACCWLLVFFFVMQQPVLVIWQSSVYMGLFIVVVIHHWTDNTLQMRVAVVVVNRCEVASVACGVAVRRPSTCGSSCWRCCRAATTVRATSSGPTASEASSSCSTPRPCRDCGASRRTSRAWTMRRWDERSGRHLTDSHTHTRLTALFRDYLGKPIPER